MNSEFNSRKPPRNENRTHKEKSPTLSRSVPNRNAVSTFPSPVPQQKDLKSEQAPLLPDWPESIRGVPSLYLRSALFGVIRRGPRKAVEKEIVATVKGLNILYTGLRLGQGDLDVLAQTLHLQNRHIEKTSDNYIRFQIKSFLRAIGRQPGKSGREWLKDSFRRLTATTIEINVDIPQPYMNKQYTYAGSLIDEFYYNNREQTYFLKINPKLAILFDSDWTKLQWQQRLQLKTDLAKWLHGFYATHRYPFAMKVETLKRLCGSDCKRLADYRRSLRKAMEELTHVQAIHAWQIDDKDKLHVQRFTNRQISK